MNIPAELFYSKSHEWIHFTSDTTARIGITAFAEDALGDIVFLSLPEEGDSLALSESFGDVESVKTVSDLVSPVAGTVAAVNEDLLDSPELLNDDPYENWLIEVDNITEKEDLLDATAYAAFCQEEA